MRYQYDSIQSYFLIDLIGPARETLRNRDWGAPTPATLSP